MRGRILDRNGVVLAEDIPSYSVAVIIDFVKNPDVEFTLLSKVISISKDQIKEKIKKANLPSYEEVVIKRNISDKERVFIEENSDSLPGIFVKTDFIRYYPFKEIGAAFIGYVGPVTLDE